MIKLKDGRIFRIIAEDDEVEQFDNKEEVEEFDEVNKETKYLIIDGNIYTTE